MAYGESKNHNLVETSGGINITKVLVGLIIVAAFFIGTLYQRVQYLEKGGTSDKEKTAVVNGKNAPQGAKDQKADNVPKVTKNDHVRGNRNAKIALIEYSDFECPFCKRFHPTAQQVMDEYGDKVMWVYRHFPLTQIHPKAQKSAEASECAAEQGGNKAFWEFSDKIFDSMPSISIDELPKLAADIGLNQNKFKDCLDSGKYTKHVNEIYQGGVKAGVTGTPGNIILNVKTGETQLIPGAVPFDQLRQAIDEMLNKE